MIIDTDKNHLSIIVGSTLSGKTTFMIERLKEVINNNIPTLFISLDLSKQNVMEKISFDEETLKSKQIYIANNGYIENIQKIVKAFNIKLLLIDSITDLMTKEKYCLGRGDIISLIIKQLKELAQELNISIIATAPTSSETNNEDINNNPAEVLSFFCKGKTAIEYVDDVYLLDVTSLAITDHKMIYGNKTAKISGKQVKVKDVNADSGEVVICGKIIKQDLKELKSGNFLLIINVCDENCTITCKFFLKPDEKDEVLERIKTVQRVIVNGIAQFDPFAKEVVIMVKNIFEA